MSAIEEVQVRGRRAVPEHDRFVAFAFAGANLVTECDSAGVVSYAAGAFRSEFGVAPEQFVGRHVSELVSPADQEALGEGLLLLRERGRLLPITIRLSNARRTPLALAGLMLPREGDPPCLCLTFAALPSPLGNTASRSPGLMRAAEARLRAGTGGELQLLEVKGARGAGASAEAIGTALHAVAPGALSGEIAPGRFGVLGEGGDGLLQVASLLEQALRSQGMAVQIASSELSLSRDGLSPSQAARALRHALTVFARQGGVGLSEAGFVHGLAGYLQKASVHVTALRRAVCAGRFDMAYQPIISLDDRKPHHYEALIRPQPIPECRLEGAQDFILLVETLGLADEVDLVIAQKACNAAQAAGVAVAFNVSGQSAQNPGFRARLLGLLKGHPAVRAGRIGVELTETADIEDVAEVARTAAALREIGVTFCLDDFGAGTADVRLLRALRADIVKLDGSYVPGVAQGGRERAFVAGMIDIARGAGAVVVAERVETEAEAEVLRALGATYAQGWLFGRPGALPASGDGEFRRGGMG